MAVPVMPLTMVRENARARVAIVYGGRGLVQRLAAMGIYPGAEVTLIRGGYSPGPLVAKVGESRIALGRGMAQRVMVEPLP